LQLNPFIGHSETTTTLPIYTHLFNDDLADSMAALDAMAAPEAAAENVVRLHG
jgi:hypothetical protein